MDKTAIKNFSIWARNKLIADITYKAGLLGITEEGIKDCSQCMVPHKRNNYPYIMSKYGEILEITRMMPEELKQTK